MIVISGATGRIGGRLAAKLAKTEYVRAIVRSEESAQKLPPGVKWRVASLENGEGMSEALANADAVVNLAGSTDTAKSPGELAIANISSAAHLFHCVPSNVSRVVHASSIAIYGKNIRTLPCDEFAHPNPDSAYARTKWQGERIAREHSIRFPVTVLRPGIVYGPGFHEGFFPVLKLLQKGKMKIIGGGENRIPLIHVDDVVSAIILSLKSRREGLSVYNVAPSPEETPTQSKLLSMASKELGVKPPSAHIGHGTAKMLAHAKQLLSSLSEKKPSFTPDMVDQLACDRVFDTSLAQAQLGWKCRIGLKEGIAQAVREYRSVSKREKHGEDS